jgi:Ala-tRNA(Pro) deacylase
MASTDTYTSLIALLDEHGAQYRLIDHPPEGRTELVSPMRGNALAQAAKCIVMMVKIGKKTTKYVLGVVPGNARVDLPAVKALLNATYVSFASPDIAERLAGSVAGDELYFNAARLDRSVVLKTRDYLTLAKPRIEGIAEHRRSSGTTSGFGS